MLDTRFPSPEARARYFVQWITATNQHGEIIIVGWCVRDKLKWKTVFKHEREDVCRKLAKILNEGDIYE